MSNIDYGSLRLQQAEIALSEGSSILVRVKELAIAMSNDTMNAEQRLGAATEVSELRQSLIDLASTKQNDEYVFANIEHNDGPRGQHGRVTYDVDLFSDVREVEIDPQRVARSRPPGPARSPSARRIPTAWTCSRCSTTSRPP